MANYLKVTPAKLTSTATTFDTKATEVQNLTSQMMSIVDGLNGAIWSGEAQAAYLGKFKGLESDMTALYKMIKAHSDHLIEMAKAYETAESKNVDASSGLKTSGIA